MRITHMTPEAMQLAIATGADLTLDDPTTGLDAESVVKAYWTSRYDEQPPGIVAKGRVVAELVTGHILTGPGPYRVEVR